jgi:murein DD-endopeptidase MepM/ murein hydrolase activator NlpD
VVISGNALNREIVTGDVDDYSGWSALDFAPPVKSGCQPSSYPVRAIAPGLVIASQRGETWVDMDQDGDIRTGWVIFYMHLATAGLVEKGTVVQTGDVLGFPSCEGGRVTGAHLHIARMFHGQWMPAHGPVPFKLGDWSAQAVIGSSYDGYLINSADEVLEACDCRDISKNVFPE